MKRSVWRQRIDYLGQRMMQQKDIGENDLTTELKRCLSTPQLTLLGVGNTIGVGIYVMLGVMAKDDAGPSVVISLMMALFVTLTNALVYAEFSTFIPQTGGAYAYIYKIFGEFAAFLCGWVMLVSFIFSSSVGARAWSGMLDSFFNNSIQAHTINTFGEIQFGMPFAESLDLVACGFQIVLTLVISFNVLCSSSISTVLGILTSSVLIFVFIFGLIYGDAKNFTNEENGGFFPFGISGVIRAASLALYAMSGFEIVALSAEEAQNPAKAVPRAIVCELLIVGSVYIAAAIGMLFLIPYWLIDLRSPLPSAFEYNGVVWAKIVVTVGPMFGITNLQMLGLYGLSRVLYRIAKDGLFFSCFLKVNKKTGVPLNSVIFVGCTTSIACLFLDLRYIVKLTVLLMLLNYVIVGSALIKLKINESNNMCKIRVEETSINKSTRKDQDFYDHELVIEHDQENIAERIATLTAVADAKVDNDINVLIDFNSEERIGNSPKPEKTRPQQESAENHDTSDKVKVKDEKGGSEITGVESIENDSDSGLDDTVFQLQPQKGGSSGSSNNKLIVASSRTGLESRNSNLRTNDEKAVKARIFKLVSLLVPGVISVNVLLFLHWICCVTIAAQVNFGWEDLSTVKPMAALSLSLLCALLAFISFLLSCLCGNTNAQGFQTPLMPLVPTLSILTSSMLLFSAAEMTGFVEVAVLLLLGSVIYIAMVQFNFSSVSDLQNTRDGDVRKSLIGDTEEELLDESSEDQL